MRGGDRSPHAVAVTIFTDLDPHVSIREVGDGIVTAGFWFSVRADYAENGGSDIGTPAYAGRESNIQVLGPCGRRRLSAMLRSARTLLTFDGASPPSSGLEAAAQALDGRSLSVRKQRCQFVCRDIPDPLARGAERLNRLENIRQALAHQVLGLYVRWNFFVVPGDVTPNPFVVVGGLVLEPSSQSLFENVGRAFFTRIQEMDTFMGNLPWPLVGTAVLPRVLRDEDVHTASTSKMEASGKVRARPPVRLSNGAKHEPWVPRSED